jgi:hypothetical protein
MYRSPLRDIPPFDKAPPYSEDFFLPYEYGFGSIVGIWRDWRKRRRERPRRRGRVLRRRGAAAGGR